MTTRAQLESEREALRMVLNHTEYQISAGYDSKVWSDRRAAITSSIERVEALLSLSDEVSSEAFDLLQDRAHSLSENACYQRGSAACETRDRASALRTVANLIRREPRGDV